MIGHNNVAVVVAVTVTSMLQRIQAHKNKLHKVRLIMGNFQKNNNVLLTSETSAIELDYEVKYYN